ncbi:hypothetical protein GCM10023333_31290 [Ferrimonas pelagia]|uniref:Uncharacterized protein n=1 Tax=Ferrimonas pelagia TaxID=1177826 RepID=A0ABP9F7E0_9GAMM
MLIKIARRADPAIALLEPQLADLRLEKALQYPIAFANQQQFMLLAVRLLRVLDLVVRDNAVDWALAGKQWCTDQKRWK